MTGWRVVLVFLAGLGVGAISMWVYYHQRIKVMVEREAKHAFDAGERKTWSFLAAVARKIWP